MLTTIKPKKSTIFLYLVIPVAAFIFTVFVPLVTALVYSFFEWKGGPNKTFNGLSNYIQLFNDGTFSSVCKNYCRSNLFRRGIYAFLYDL